MPTPVNIQDAVEIDGEDIKRRLKGLFSATDETRELEMELDRKISDCIQEFLRDERASTEIELAALAEFARQSRIPDLPSGVLAYLDDLAGGMIRHSTHTASPRFIGHMTTALPYFVRPFGKLITALNQNPVKVETAKSFTAFERQALAMMHRLVYDEPDDFYEHHIQQRDSTLGIITTGGTAANMTALWCARNASLKAKDQFKGCASKGVSAALADYGERDAVIIGSSLIHYSFDKAADLLGIGSNNLIRVPTDENGRIDLDLLRQTILRCRKLNRRIIALIGVAGATDCGAIDPLFEMAEIAREYHIHFHVDAAWGGPLLFSRLHKDKLNGIEMANSVTIDGHKQLYLPMGLGMVLLRDPQSAKVIERNAQYIIRSGSHDLGKRALEGSRPAMALYLHASLSIFGSRGYEILIDESMRMARFMADAIREKPEFQLLMEPQLNIVTYRYVPKPWRGKSSALDESDNDAVSRFNIRLQKAQRREGKGFVSRTRLGRTRYGNSIVSLRAVIANPLTTEHDISAVLDDQIRLSALEGVSCE